MVDTKNFGEQLKDIRNKLINIKNEAEQNPAQTLQHLIKIRLLLAPVENCDNKKLSFAALTAICELWPKSGISMTTYPTCENFIAVLENVIKTIDEELPKEEKLDSLEGKIREMQIIFPKDEEHDTLGKLFQQNARKIARLISES